MKHSSKLFLFIVIIALIVLPNSVTAANYSPSPLRPPTPANKPSLTLPYIDPSINMVAGFGTNTHNDVYFTTHTHYGVDFATDSWLDDDWDKFTVVASAGGTLTHVTWTGKLPSNTTLDERTLGCDEDIDPTLNGSQTRVAMIDHGDGWFTIYLHLSSYIGDERPVNQGDPIGTTGCSGTYWPHLHFELRHYFEDGTVWSYNPEFSSTPAGPSLDIAFLIDTTGSMYDDIDRVKADASQIINSIKDKNPNSRIAVLDFRDFPSRSIYYDYPYRDALSFTYSQEEAINAIQGLDLGWGGDEPESVNCAIMHAISNDRCAGQGFDTSLGPWASPTRRVIVMTDSYPLDPEPFTGFTLEQVTSRASADNFSYEFFGGLEDEYGDGSPLEEGVAFYPVIIGDYAPALAYGQALADATDGKVFYAATADDVVDALLEAITNVVATFADVPSSHWAWDYVERLYGAGITGGCSTSPLAYCPNNSVTRAQMAVFLEKGLHYPIDLTPADMPPTFNDTAGHWAEDWIEALKDDGVTSGCGGGNYCPNNPITRAQMAVFLLKSKYGSAYTPPDVGVSTGFTDVPTTHWAAPWIKQLAVEGITGGCGGGNYCPNNSVTRAQMAVFLVKTFSLP